MLKLLSDLQNIKHKKVLLRIDSDVDIKSGRILDDSRLNASMPTIEYLLKHAGIVYVVGHLGRPDHKFKVQSEKFKVSEDNLEFTLAPVARWLAQRLMGAKVERTTTGNFSGWKLNESLILLENIRFFEGEEDPSSSSGQDLIKSLKELGDIYVNDAFAVSHRKHASIYGIAKVLPSYAGLHLVKEVRELSKVLDNPKRPLAVIIGGAKIETKLPLVEAMHHLADFVLVGGEIAEQDKILAKVAHEKIEKSEKQQKSILLVADLQEDGFDITDKSADNFVQVINTAATIVWNGPMGLTGKEKESEEGTLAIAKAVSESKAYKIVGGGDTLSYLKRMGLLGKFDFVSMGGGAMLEFLSGKKLPGIEVLEH